MHRRSGLVLGLAMLGLLVRVLVGGAADSSWAQAIDEPFGPAGLYLPMLSRGAGARDLPTPVTAPPVSASCSTPPRARTSLRRAPWSNATVALWRH